MIKFHPSVCNKNFNRLVYYIYVIPPVHLNRPNIFVPEIIPYEAPHIRRPICVVTHVSVAITLTLDLSNENMLDTTDGSLHNTLQNWYPFITAWMIYRLFYICHWKIRSINYAQINTLLWCDSIPVDLSRLFWASYKLIESIKTTSMEDASTGVLEKINNI